MNATRPDRRRRTLPIRPEQNACLVGREVLSVLMDPLLVSDLLLIVVEQWRIEGLYIVPDGYILESFLLSKASRRRAIEKHSHSLGNEL